MNLIDLFENQTVGYAGMPRTPHVFVPFCAPNLTYPLSPHQTLQEFLTKKYGIPFSVPYPTTKTAWFNSSPHSTEVMTPLLQYWKRSEVPSIATEIGPLRATAALS